MEPTDFDIKLAEIFRMTAEYMESVRTEVRSEHPEADEYEVKVRAA